MARSLRFWNKGFASNAINPPDFGIYNRLPVASDYKIFDIGYLWLAEVGATPDEHKLYMLFDKQKGSATWYLLNNTGDVTFESVTITTGDLTLEDGGLQIHLINFTSTLRTLSDGTVYGLADTGAPASEATIYHPNNSGVVQWGDLTSSGSTVTITTTIDGINLEAAGGTAVATLTADDANVVSPTAGGNFFILGGSNINTTAATANTVIFNVDDSPTFTDLTVNNDLTVSGKFTSYLEINTQAGTAYTLVLTDDSKEIQFTNAAAVTLTIPTNATVAFPIGTQIILVQYGAGTVTVSPAGGVVINSAGSRLDLYEQYSSCALIKQASDTWLLAGDIK